MKVNKYKRVNKKGRKYITLTGIKGQSLNLREVEDIQNEKMKNVIPVVVDMKKNGFVLKYDVTNYMPLDQYLHTIINREKFAKLILEFFQIIRTMSDAYYNTENLVLDLNMAYINPSTETLYIIFVPILYYKGGYSVKEFLLQITYQTTFDSMEDTSYVEKYINILQKNMNFSTVEMEEYLKSLILNKNNPDYKEKQRVPVPKEYKLQFDEKREEQLQENGTRRTEENIGEIEEDRSRMTESLSDIGDMGTALLGTETKAYIKQLRTGIKYYLCDDVVTIGKKQCQIVITDNPAVSKQHAVFQKKNGQYYLIDCNSTNGTKVDGKRICNNKPELLKDETQFELANEKFIFYR